MNHTGVSSSKIELENTKIKQSIMSKRWQTQKTGGSEY
jgi:hypothetical protein